MNRCDASSQPFHPRVDVVIAARNEARFLAKCLESLAEQNYPMELLHVIVVDNGSSDGTGEIACEYGATVVRHEARGVAAARNAGIAHGHSELVAFLDAHCCAEPAWLRLLAGRFSDEKLGGCQGRLENRSESRRIERYLETSPLFSEKRIVAETVGGKSSLFAWILGGNCMYRRAALLQAGGFNELLPSCEDVDLAWRVLLAGYRLDYEPGAHCIHYDRHSWHGFLHKNFLYGRGAAWLSRAYRAQGAGRKYPSSRLLTPSLEGSLAALYYDAGYRWQSLRILLGLDRPLPVAHEAENRLRPKFFWSQNFALQISPGVVYWFCEPESESVVVHVAGRARLVLAGASDFIWRALTTEASREEVAAAMAETYGIGREAALADLDEFIEEAIATGVIVRHEAPALADAQLRKAHTA